MSGWLSRTWSWMKRHPIWSILIMLVLIVITAGLILIPGILIIMGRKGQVGSIRGIAEDIGIYKELYNENSHKLINDIKYVNISILYVLTTGDKISLGDKLLEILNNEDAFYYNEYVMIAKQLISPQNTQLRKPHDRRKIIHAYKTLYGLDINVNDLSKNILENLQHLYNKEEYFLILAACALVYPISKKQLTGKYEIAAYMKLMILLRIIYLASRGKSNDFNEAKNNIVKLHKYLQSYGAVRWKLIKPIITTEQINELLEED